MLNQRDDRWKLKRINGTYSTIGAYGCLITCIAETLRRAGYDVWPDDIAHTGDLFSGDLWTGWYKLPEIYPQLKYAWGEVCLNQPAPIDKIIQELDDGYYPIIMLDSQPGGAVDTHYLLCLEHNGKDIKVGDPWDGAEVWLDSRYGTWDEDRKILKVDVYHFDKPIANDNEMERIIKFLEEKEMLNEGGVREMYGAWKDKPNLEKDVETLKKANQEKQSVLEQKDVVISDLNNTLQAKKTEIDSYKSIIREYAELLDTSPDAVAVKGQIKELLGNEDKLDGCLRTLKDERDNQQKEIDKAVRNGLVALEGENKKLDVRIDELEDDVERLDKLYRRWKAIAQDKRPSLLIKIKEWLKKLIGFPK